MPVTGVLHRDFCRKRRSTYVKDLSKLGRKLEKIICVDHDPVIHAGCTVCSPERPCLFDVRKDEAERDNIAAAHGALVERMAATLAELARPYSTA